MSTYSVPVPWLLPVFLKMGMILIELKRTVLVDLKLTNHESSPIIRPL